ncbi:MAG: sigma-70 family RNA polymerase sigma factor [Tannerellaceae bacterium]|jgi:RNA polymerase sigma-70 factor (ECF subfamily)|nr:sigma-70 family RNA polymerase sigma factor [Tannerellaceae bacterium]
MELEAFKIKIVPLRERLLNICLALVRDEADAEDIVQETFLKLWQMRNTLDNYRNVEALAVTMSRNLSLDKLRMQKPGVSEKEMLGLASADASPDKCLEHADAVECIRMLVGRLPSLQQTIVRMKDIEGYELAEIAGITGSSPEAVRVNLSRARKRIREQFIALNRESCRIP